MRHVTIHAEDEVKRSCQCTGWSISPIVLYVTSPKCCKRQKKKWQQDWIKKWPIIFTDSYSVLALGWGLEMVWVHEWALLQCQHNWISEVHESHRPHNKPGHGFISYWFKALLEMLPCSPVQFPLIYTQLEDMQSSCEISTCSKSKIQWERKHTGNQLH